MLALARRRQHNIAYNRISPLTLRNNGIFRKKIKFDKGAISDLVQIVDPYLAQPNQNGLTLSKENQVLLFLSSIGTNGFQSLVCDRFGCSQQTASNIINRVVHGLTDPTVVSFFIRFPVQDARWRRRASADFSRICGLPNVIGAVDGTLIRIDTPPASNNTFRCRKGYSALNCTFIVDFWGRILYCNPRYPGSTHDSFVFENSTARRALNSLNCPHGYAILGDKGYSNGARVMTPFARPSNAKETRFNKLHCKTRVIVEQVFGMLKKRFPALCSRLRYTPEKCARFVLAAAVLWNYGLDRGHGLQRGRGFIHRVCPLPPASRNVRAVIAASL
ncbi:hypothetical protein PMAYCL1PPCAC_24860 [Pristionchus mayeri]|uniref:Putative nuclease HARBI1 n=1 Tax=Pristionchus mayeri TaxID=1317129 RepID=A0AAN4ZB64_9BILA|nr:hypothetical protein PMAYCL1PPCAC_07590 [Pristionchus mayeri]GMR37426.1 hypothetical protein PMAYCL1PPCAC_07621 [Pristionchus mayeri]GMR37935.1 hypothetical protein PMAYCL1PPCAC_08130 [Pristionchus mayeri]GMR39733.1 hypothetical protein PMAYCL1PPCAC_09928 [Pristionchus mayeri]GMR54665.1 hypothetical protein PMAYCL1PPCAC_24860 [Pristionchus mayeri]